MKTVVQELKDKFMESGTLADWMDQIFDIAIEKERMQIIEAHIEIMKMGLISEGVRKWCEAYLPKIKEEAEKYYNQVFKNS